jgi:hypothetical protein
MRNGPVRIVLIRSGKYDYAEVELDGALQIVGDNNMGKTTLINTLQFLYIDEKNKMNFGSYSLDQTLEYYFPTQYSYILFECRTLRGLAVVGWRGNSKASNADPERFSYLGPYCREHFFTELGQIREPLDVKASLALCHLQLLTKPSQHREMLLAGAGANGSAFGIVSLKDNEKFHHFRETLKNLLTLSIISQEQMRDRLLMLAEIPTDAVAVDARRVLGEDHDQLLRMRDELELFKTHSSVITDLVAKFDACMRVRGEQIYRWTLLKTQKEEFESAHRAALAALDEQIKGAAAQEQAVSHTLTTKRSRRDGFISQKATLENHLKLLETAAADFAGFAEELERGALADLEKRVFEAQSLLITAASEKIEDVAANLEDTLMRIAIKERAIDQFGKLAITALREEFSDQELGRIFGIISADLLELPLGRKGISITSREGVFQRVRHVLDQIKDEVYQDELLTIRFNPASSAIAKLESVEALRKELRQLQGEQVRLEKLANAVRDRQKCERELALLVEQKNRQTGRIHSFQDFQTMRAKEEEWRKELTAVQKAIGAVDGAIEQAELQANQARQLQLNSQAKHREESRQFEEVRKQFEKCRYPLFESTLAADTETPPNFESAIGLYLREQDRERDLARELESLFIEIQRSFGDRYQASTESGTIQNLKEELEAVGERENALVHEWNAHIQGLKSRFKQVLDDLNQIQTATTRLNKSFAQVQVSDLKAIKLSVDPEADVVGVIRRLAGLEELNLWSDQTPLENALQRVREWLTKTPIIRMSELFTLVVSVTAADGKIKHYRDFRQIESDGTTVAIKVLFNLLVLKSQLRKEDVAVPFFLDEIEKLDAANRRAVLQTAKALGFIAITAAPSAVGEVNACYFLERRPSGYVKLTSDHRLQLQPKESITQTE